MPRNSTQNEQMRAESRDKIIATARQLFAQQGYDGCNVSDIARQAGMSQGNIYYYFSSKQDVLKAIILDGYEKLGTMMADIAAGNDTGIEKLHAIVARYIEMSREQGGDEFITIIMTLLRQGGVQHLSNSGTDTAAVGTRFHRSLSTILIQAQSEGTIDPTMDPNHLTTFFFAFFNGLVMMYPEDWKDIPLEMIDDAMLRLLGHNRK